MESCLVLHLESVFFFVVHVVTPLLTADKVGERVGQTEGAEAGGIITTKEPSLRPL